MIMRIAGLAGIAAAAAVGLAPMAQADDVMYRVSTDIPAGDYTYRVVGADFGAWYTCSDTSCQVGAGCIDMDAISGAGATGYMTIPASAKYVKLTNLALTPM
jgi:hypothetical protein